MSTSDLSTKGAGAGMLAAIIASLCCITPVFSLLAGVGGIAATFSWMEPFRPYLIALTVSILGFAWYQKLKPATAQEIACDCEDDKPSFWQSKKFLGIVTIFAALMLAFPGYAHLFYPEPNNKQSSLLLEQDSTRTDKIVFSVKGMTCSGCESHIVYEVARLQGVKTVEASYANGTASVEYFPSKLKSDDIIIAINNTGYKVINDDEKVIGSIEATENISFYKVPLVCNAAPTIGCGSRSKPILEDFEKSAHVDEAWLNRKGTVIAIVWKEKTDFKVRRDLVNEIFTKHKVNANELLMNDYAENYESFEHRADWLQGSDVDKLSKEEATIIANQVMKAVKEKTALTPADETKMNEKITATFYDFFLSYKSLEELGDPKVYQSKLSEIKSFGEELLGEGNMPSVDELWSVCSGASKSCSHQGCSGSSTCKIPKKS